jgi:hypothetical protein
VTHYLLSLGLPEGEELAGCEIAQGLVGADLVIGMLPILKGPAKGGDLQVAVIDFIEFLRVGTLSSFHTPIQLGGAGW